MAICTVPALACHATHIKQWHKGLCAPVGGSTFFTNMKMAFSGLTLILLRMTYTNCPTVRSAGTRYLQDEPW